jgi:hypothetical protein
MSNDVLHFNANFSFLSDADKFVFLCNNFATDDIISLSSEVSNQINFSSLLKNCKFGYY